MPEFTEPTPRNLGYRFPAEWAKHRATWLSYPHNEASWPGKIHTIFPYYRQFIKEIAKGEEVHVNVLNDEMRDAVHAELAQTGASMNNIFFHIHPTNDAWCRDHGPAFVVKPGSGQSKAIISWQYNGWGGKYPAELDSQIPGKIGALKNLRVFYPGIVMEGGSVDFNGKGTILTTTSCLLNPNRNPGLSKGEIEQYLLEFYGANQVLWLGDGIEGDDTDGHIDDLTRFVNEDTVVTVVEPNKSDANHIPLKENLKALNRFRLTSDKQMNIVEIPMPEPMYYQDQRLPVSYANFYIANAGVIVPVYRCKQDNKAIYLFEECFKDRPVIGLDSVEIIWGLGSWHCLSQQEPA
jgi:agmatine deiminase